MKSRWRNIFTVIFAVGMGAVLPIGSVAVLCVGTDGHVALESKNAWIGEPSHVHDGSHGHHEEHPCEGACPTVSQSSDEHCGSCTDYVVSNAGHITSLRLAAAFDNWQNVFVVLPTWEQLLSSSVVGRRLASRAPPYNQIFLSSLSSVVILN